MFPEDDKLNELLVSVNVAVVSLPKVWRTCKMKLLALFLTYIVKLLFIVLMTMRNKESSVPMFPYGCVHYLYDHMERIQCKWNICPHSNLWPLFGRTKLQNAATL